MQISFWAIIASIVIGVLSNLITPGIRTFLGQVSKSMKDRNDQRKAIIESTVQFVFRTPQEETILRLRYMQRSLAVMLGAVISLVLMLSNNPVLVILGFVSSLVAYYGLGRAEKLGKVIDRVGKLKMIGHPEIDLS